MHIPLRNMSPFRPTTVFALIVALSVSAIGTYKALTFPSASSAVPAGRAIQTGDIGDSAHAPEFLLTKTEGLQFQTSLTPIEGLQVGQRVRADAPTDDVDRQFGDEVVPSEWQKLTLTAPKQDGTVADVVLLRPRWWIGQQQAEVDGQVFISVPECGINGEATVHRIDPCPEIVSGPGRVITGTFRHRVSSGIELSVEGEEQPIRCTGNHPIWSEDRHDFVRADSLRVGDTLRNTTELTQVVASRSLSDSTFVYNIEVHGAHVYYVGKLGTLVHNGDPADCIKWVNSRHPKIGGKVVSILPKGRTLGKLPGYPDVPSRIAADASALDRWRGWPVHAYIEKGEKIFDSANPKGISRAEWFGEFARRNNMESVFDINIWADFVDGVDAATNF